MVGSEEWAKAPVGLIRQWVTAGSVLVDAALTGEVITRPGCTPAAKALSDEGACGQTPVGGPAATPSWMRHAAARLAAKPSTVTANRLRRLRALSGMFLPWA